MAAKVLDDLQTIQKYVYGQYKSDGSSNIEWLSVRFCKIVKFSILTNKNF